jgi:signal transduction histidine kinase
MNPPQETHPSIFSRRVVPRFLILFLPIFVLTSAAVVGLYSHDLGAERALHEQAGQHLVDLHAAIISREVESIKADLLYLADASVLRSYLSGRASGRRELEEEFILFCRRKGIYDQIRYLDPSGHEQVRVNQNNGRPAAVPEAELQLKAGRYYFTQTMLLERGEVFVSPFDLNVEHEEIERPHKPTIRFATPVFDAERRKRGILILNYLGASLLKKLDEVSVSFQGSVWLLNRAGYYLRGPGPQEEWGFMLGHKHSFAAEYSNEWRKVLAEEQGQFHTAHGLFTFRVLPPPGRKPATRDVEEHDAGLVLVSHVPSEVRDRRSTVLLRRLLLFTGAALLLLLVLSWYLAHAGVLRQNHERQLEQSEARLRALSARLLTAQEEERRSLARDLHDELGQVVTTVTLNLQRAAQSSERMRKDELISQALSGTGRVLDQIHEITARVRPTLLDDLGLKAAIQSFLGDYEARTGIAVRAELHLDEPLSAVASENLYRILQEGLTNVSRHAKVSEAFVTLTVAGGQATLSIRDEGVGFDPATLDGARFGLLGIRERAELLTGSFSLHSSPGKGTEVRVSVPVSEPRTQ